MTKIITIATGSVRPNSVGSKLLPLVKELLEARDVTVQIADMKELQLPFFDAPVSPLDESFTIEHESVQRWQKLVTSSDGLIFITPEYNFQMTPVQKNAIDWLYKEWNKKPVATVAYGWTGGSKAAEALQVLLEKVAATPVAEKALLRFTQEIAVDGEILDEAAVNERLEATINKLLAAL